MKKNALWLGVVLGAALLLVLSRPKLDVDLFTLLPQGSWIVDSLKLYQESFGTSWELVLSVRSDDAETTEAVIGELAQELEKAALSPKILWKNPLRDDPAELGEILAYLWLNQEPEEFNALAARLQEDQLVPTVENTLERITTSMRPREIAFLSRDPFALTELPIADGDLPVGEDAEDPFASADGTFRVLFAATPFEDGGYWEFKTWVTDVENMVQAWQAASTYENVRVRVTGNPALVKDAGGGLLSDMRNAAISALFLVATLFYLAHRRWRPLIWLVVLLLVVISLTVAVGSWVLGPLNAVSLGFAAILMGLAADYGLILYQELKVHPERSLAVHRRTVAPSILWAAVTTAGAFFMVSRSSLPGLVQIGTMVGIGILVASAVMLTSFLPPLVSGARQEGEKTPLVFGATEKGRKTAWAGTAVALVGAVVVLLVSPPTVDTNTANLGPKDGESYNALNEVRSEISGGDLDKGIYLIVAGENESDVLERLNQTAALLDAEVESGHLASHTLPRALWPRPAAQAANLETARQLAPLGAPARQAALEAGFTDEALLLTEGVFSAWEHFSNGASADATPSLNSAGGVVWPSRPGADWLIRKFAAYHDGEVLALGKVEPSETATDGSLLELSHRIRDQTQGRLLRWSFLGNDLLSLMRKDLLSVLIPMGIVIMVFLGLAFRRPGEIVLSLMTMGLSLLALLGVMGIFGWSWNIMNVMGLPFLFGAGVDYSIHIQLALQRHKGDISKAHQTVGRAILLCGASTASGFGTLAFASNEGMSTLGQVCAAGIVLSALIAVFLLPVWWRAIPGHVEERKTAA